MTSVQSPYQTHVSRTINSTMVYIEYRRLTAIIGAHGRRFYQADEEIEFNPPGPLGFGMVTITNAGTAIRIRNSKIQKRLFSEGCREIVLPTGFEPVSKPREGFMIGRYTTGATSLGNTAYYICVALQTRYLRNRWDGWLEASCAPSRRPASLSSRSPAAGAPCPSRSEGRCGPAPCRTGSRRGSRR